MNAKDTAAAFKELYERYATFRARFDGTTEEYNEWFTARLKEDGILPA